MPDIRLERIEMSDIKDVKATPKEAYELEINAREELYNVLPLLMKLDYWSPQYQAWEPFLTSYLRSGNNPELATKYLEIMKDKIDEMTPVRGKHSAIHREMKRAYRSQSSEIFKDYTWGDLCDFAGVCVTYCEFEKAFKQYTASEENYLALLRALLKVEGAEPYSRNLVYAIYLYRHCMMGDCHPVDEELKAMMQGQVDAYVRDYGKHFNVVQNFVKGNADVYQWYTPQIKKLIQHAWRSSLDLSDKRRVLGAKDVFNMPVWLSEQLTDYINILPCVYTTEVDDAFIFDAWQYAVTQNLSDPTEPGLLYIFCIPREYLTRCIKALSTFSWDVKDHKIVQWMYDRVVCKFAAGDDENAINPVDYYDSLVERGYPTDTINPIIPTENSEEVLLLADDTVSTPAAEEPSDPLSLLSAKYAGDDEDDELPQPLAEDVESEEQGEGRDLPAAGLVHGDSDNSANTSGEGVSETPYLSAEEELTPAADATADNAEMGVNETSEDEDMSRKVVKVDTVAGMDIFLPVDEARSKFPEKFQMDSDLPKGHTDPQAPAKDVGLNTLKFD